MTSNSAVARELLAYGLQLHAEQSAQFAGSFTGDAEADALLRSSPEAFLIGVLFTQGIPAERAWRGPFLLQRRLGHLDVRRLASEERAVRDAVQQPPMLHRFKETIPRWVCGAARRLLAEYEGDASRVWAAGSHVLDVTARLTAFDGIGRKKAAMAVEILQRHFGVSLEGRRFGQVAYDVHVRRVFLRAGLAERDSPDAIEGAAAAVSPDAPALLDLAAWLVGRQTCRPRNPACGACRLGRTCPRLTGVQVEGVAPRR